MTIHPIPLGQQTPPLGGTVPLIAAPIVAATPAEALRQASVMRDHAIRPDIAELRIDQLRDMELDEFAEVMRDIAAILGPPIPLLATNRLTTEGGSAGWSDDGRIATLQIAIVSRHVALIDIELATPAAVRAELIAVAHAHACGVIISAHDFQITPTDKHLDDWLADLISAGGDAAKLAVTARTPDDALRLLTATQRASRYATIPLIALAMGTTGTITRLAGPFFGSALSFATIDAVSAPGQLPIALLRDYWRAAGLR